MTYDIIIIGGGPGGYLAAERAGHAGQNVLLIEKRALGGVCLNEGCIPSKTLLNSAKVLDYAKHGESYGVSTSGASIDHKAVVSRKNSVIKTLQSGIRAQLKAASVTVIESQAHILGKGSDGFSIGVNSDTHTCKNLIIATGSEAFVPPIPGADNPMMLTSREILDIGHIPGELVVIGGGVIGLEMASYFNSAGSIVTVIEMLGQIGGQNDPDICKILQNSYSQKGIKFLLNSKVTRINSTSVEYEQNGVTSTLNADTVLMSIGRRAVTSGFGLESLNVLIEHGAIVTDGQCKTNIPNLYAIGDVNGKSMLAHTAYREAEVAVSTILGTKDAVNYKSIPAVIYTSPEVGAVGETEATAASKGIDVTVKTIPMVYSGRYVAENSVTDGICKLIINNKTNRLIGAHIIGSYASEIIMNAAIMIDTEMNVERIKRLVFPHPTVCEILREGLFM